MVRVNWTGRGVPRKLCASCRKVDTGGMGEIGVKDFRFFS